MAVGAAGMIAIAIADSPVPIALAAGLWGIASGANWVLSSEAQQRLAPDWVLGRLSGLDSFGSTLSMCVGAALVAVAADGWDAGPQVLLGATAVASVMWGVLFSRGATPRTEAQPATR